MSQILSVVRAFPPERPVTLQEYDRVAAEYIQRLLQIPSSEWTKGSENETLLDVLDVRLNSIPYTIALLEFLRAGNEDEAATYKVLTYVASYLSRFDPAQVRYVNKQWQDLFSALADVYRTLRIADIDILATALLRLDTAANTFTRAHLLYLRLCIEMHQPSKAVLLLDRNIYSYLPDTIGPLDNSVSDESTTESKGATSRTPSITSQDVLEYYLLGAHIYISHQLWPRAQLFLELVVLYPSPQGTTSALQVEAYKKWVLVTLMRDQKIHTHSWATGGQIAKSLQTTSRAYESIATSFQRRDWRKLQAEIDIGSDIWQRDGNSGLVAAVSQALLRYCVLDLCNTYTALPISRVAKHLGVTTDQASQLLNSLIAVGQLEAQVDNSVDDNTLRFNLVKASALDDDALASQKQRIDELIQNVKDASVRLQLSKEYIEATKRAKRQGIDSDPADQMDLDWTSNPPLPGNFNIPDDDGDEDIMA